jgi:tetratricopeptide (TPR) repeat protein
VRAFLDATPLPELAGKAAFRQKCLEELRAARKSQALAAGTLDPHQLAEGTADFARFSEPTHRLDAEWRMVVGVVNGLDRAGHKSLAWLLGQRPAEGSPLLVVAVRYFFRRAVEEDQKLFQGLSFARLEALGEAQERGFAALSAALAQQGERLEEVLIGVQAVVVQTHGAVLDLRGQLQGQGEQIEQIGQAVQKLLEQHQLQRREVRPGDSLSIRNEGERQLVKQLVARYRSLPQGQRQDVPALLNAIGKLEVVAGNFDQAQRDFQQVATMVADTGGKAEAHFNAYRAVLERRDWDTALRELVNAVKLDGKRFAPFPVGKYHPRSILGAGGFGVAFLCRHKELKAEVVVKTLTGDDLERNVDEVLGEARVLYQLDHPAIIRVLDCGYTIPAEKTRPYFVMSFFEGVTMEEYVQKHGPLSPHDLIAVAQQMAEGLQAAHGKNILHRDVKPANVLVRKDDSGWQVKLIDFGLALKQQVIDGAQATAKQKATIIASSIAGTLDYGAPEQMGRRNEPIGPYSDVYGWAKTCCHALFQTAQPLLKHWKSVPEPLAELLEKCLEEDPKNRPQGFHEVLTILEGLTPALLSGKDVAPGEREGGIGQQDNCSIRDEQIVGPTLGIGRGKHRPLRNPHRRLPWRVGACIGLLVVALFAVGVMALRPGRQAGEVAGERERREPPTARPTTNGSASKPTQFEKPASPEAKEPEAPAVTPPARQGPPGKGKAKGKAKAKAKAKAR